MDIKLGKNTSFNIFNILRFEISKQNVIKMLNMFKTLKLLAKIVNFISSGIDSY